MPYTDTERLRFLAEDREICRFLYDILYMLPTEKALDVARAALDGVMAAETEES